jgi:hypothetical protein
MNEHYAREFIRNGNINVRNQTLKGLSVMTGQGVHVIDPMLKKKSQRS